MLFYSLIIITPVRPLVLHCSSHSAPVNALALELATVLQSMHWLWN